MRCAVIYVTAVFKKGRIHSSIGNEITFLFSKVLSFFLKVFLFLRGKSVVVGECVSVWFWLKKSPKKQKVFGFYFYFLLVWERIRTKPWCSEALWGDASINMISLMERLPAEDLMRLGGSDFHFCFSISSFCPLQPFVSHHGELLQGLKPLGNWFWFVSFLLV